MNIPNISNITVSADIVPSDDPDVFIQQVRLEANRIAALTSETGIPSTVDVEALVPFVRLHLMAQRKKSLFDRVAGAIKVRVDSILGQKAVAEREVRDLFALQQEYAGIIDACARAVGKLHRADETAAMIREIIEATKADVPRYYTGEKGGGGSTSPAENVIAAYREIASGEKALAEFDEVRHGLENEVSKIEASIAAFEAKHADLIGEFAYNPV